MNNLTGANYIAGTKSKKGKDSFKSFNPRTKENGKVSFFNATKDEIDKSVKKAEGSFKIILEFSDKKLADFLKTLSEEIMNLGDQLIETCDIETALGENRLINERKRTCNQIEMFADYIERGSYVEAIIDKKLDDSPDIRRMLLPIGPVAVFPASNFPFAFGVCGGDTVSAFAAKCPVVVKAHPLHPETSELFAKSVYKSIEKHNFPKGFFSMIQGNKKEVSKEIVIHPNIKAVGFTGSRTVGRILFDIASKRTEPIPVYAEMGSINPVFITKKSMEKRNNELAQEFSDSITLGNGQFCTKPGVIFVNDDKYTDEFIEQTKKIMNEKEPGFLIHKKIKEGLKRTVDKTKKIDGVELVLGGNEIKDKTIYENTLFVTNSKKFIEEKQLHMEHFGPVSFIVKCKNMDEFLKISEEMEGQLTATIHLEKEDYGKIKPLITKLSRKVGRIIINGVPTGVRVCNAMQHGGPYPATTFPNTTSVGTQAIKRFLRPISFQDFPEELLPIQIRNENKKKILRFVDGKYKRE